MFAPRPFLLFSCNLGGWNFCGIWYNDNVMVEFTLKLAQKRIACACLYESTRTFCFGYESDGAADFSVALTPEDIAFEAEKSRREALAEGREPRTYTDAYLETLALYRKIAERMPLYDGEAYLFTAKSGTGKSTHTRLWREVFGERAVMINDDKPLIRITESGLIAYGTPWNGKHHIGTNASAPLKAICYVTRDTTNHIEPISDEEMYPILAQQVYRPANVETLLKTLVLLDRMQSIGAFYRLGCNMEPEAATVAYTGMQGGKQ